MRCFDKQNNRLIYIEQKATPDFWDARWQTDTSTREKIVGLKNTYVLQITKKYLKPEDGFIIEGGCGYAQHVAALTNNNYRCIGVDYAQQTVQALQKAVPELDVRLGDIQHLKFDDAYFAGYWSIGVIEHFWNGYTAAGLEMARVIKPGGYLFLTFPYMSRLRKFKAKFGFYPKYKQSQSPAHFYQFALDHEAVIRNFTEWGFNIVKVQPRNGLKGAKDEITILKGLLKTLYNYPGSSILVRGLRRVLSEMLSPITGHTILLVFKKEPV